MTIRAAIAGAVVVAATLVGSARGQSWGGANVGGSAAHFSKRDAKSATEGAIALQRMGACIFRSERSRSLLLLESRPGSEDEDEIGSAMKSHMSRCIDMRVPWLHWSWAELRGTIAATAYAARFPTDPGFGSAKHEQVPLPAKWAGTKLTEGEVSRLLAQDAALCIVADAPGKVARLVRTEARSAEERDALTAIVPLIGPCLMKDVKMSADPASLRAQLSEALYRSATMWEQSGVSRRAALSLDGGEKP